MPGRGRPSVYTEEAAEEICRRLADGEALHEICRDDHLPSDGAVKHWVVDDREGFAAKYARARQAQALSLSDEITRISDADYTLPDGSADGAMIQQARLRVDSRKWLLSKILPKVFGDRTEIVGAGGKDLIPQVEIDNGKIALAIVGLLQAAKKEEK